MALQIPTTTGSTTTTTSSTTAAEAASSGGISTTATSTTTDTSTVHISSNDVVRPTITGTTSTTNTNTNTNATSLAKKASSPTAVSQLSTTYTQTTFRNMSMNSIAVVPLLSTNTNHNQNNSNTTTTTHSTKSYHEFMATLQQHAYTCCRNSQDVTNNDTATTVGTNSTNSNTNTHSNNNSSTITLLVPNNNLTRPSDWKYETTPFHSFHWNYGCQRLLFHDGRPSSMVMEGDKRSHHHHHNHHQQHPPDHSLYYHYTAASSYRNYVDLYPHRRTAAIIGILNIQDCIIDTDTTSTSCTADDVASSHDNPSNTMMTTAQMIQQACEELQQWAHRYSSPSYGASTYGHTSSDHDNGSSTGIHRDIPVTRLFLYDSFNIDTPEIIFDIQRQAAETILFDTNSIIAFPPTTIEHQAAMTLHYNLVLSDLMVAIFRNLEQKVTTATRLISALDQSTTGSTGSSNSVNSTAVPSSSSSVATDSITTTGGLARRSLARFTITTTTPQDAARPNVAITLGINQLADFVDPDSTLAKTSPRNNNNSNNNSTVTTDDVSGSATTSVPATVNSIKTNTKLQPQNLSVTTTTISKLFQLLTPLDDELMTMVMESPTMIGIKDMEVLKKREMGRRYKYIGDYCLLAGSPLDAYENYLKAMELCKGSGTSSTATTTSTSKSSSTDPLWYAATLEACAVAHIVMAEIGGYGVDEYLENNFQLPEEIMALARDDPSSRKQFATGNKQTLPEVIFALCDESLNILNRHDKLANLYTELILKLAVYTAEEAESHLRCRWGEGIYCYAGEGDTGSSSQPKRWEKTSVSKLKFNALRTKDGYSMITINTHNRTKKLCSLLNSAVSIGSLDPPTRVDVAVRCVRICLVGVKPTHWKGPTPERVKLPRKAAYFTVVAADAMTDCYNEIGKTSAAQNLWLIATRLYTCKPNPIDGEGDYGWATLRAFCLDCLSTQGSTDLSMEAADQLLSLLGHLNPVILPMDDSGSTTLSIDSDRKIDDERSVPMNDESNKEEKKNKDLPRAAISLEDPDLREAISTANQFAKNIRTTYGNLTAASPLLAQQSKWVADKPIPSIEVPLSNSSHLSSVLVSLKAVWPHMSYDITAVAQRHCLERAAPLRRAIPKRSTQFDITTLYGFDEKELPIYISSDIVMQQELALELECIKKRIPSDTANGGGMETFYNPFAKKAADDGPFARIAEDEERIITVRFGNCLAVPLHIQRSQLEFEYPLKVKITTLSFVIPPKSSDFTVDYPILIASDHQRDKEADDCYSLEIKGVSMMCLGRQIFLPIKSSKKVPSIIAGPSRLHSSHSPDDSAVDDLPSNPQIECYPCQPNLNILYAETKERVPDVISISIVDGEIFTFPAFHLENNSYGRNKVGKIETLEISWIGTPNRKLYDSSVESIPDVSIEEFVDEMIYGADANGSPFKIRALSNELNIVNLNKFPDRTNDKNVVVFQIAASCTLRSRLPEGCTVSLVFRYCGTGTMKTDVWRKRTITLHVSPVSGPRIRSIEFRPDLMMNHLNFTDDVNNQCIPKAIKIETNRVNSITESSPLALNTEMITQGIGQYSSVSICGSKSLFVLTVDNESSSEIIISCKIKESDVAENTFGYISMINELVILPGVSAKFPMILPRITRVDENGTPVDVLSALIRRTTLFWKSCMNSSNGSRPLQQGYLSIPSTSVSAILYRHCPSSISQICTPPIGIELLVADNTAVVTDATIPMKSCTIGQPVVVTMRVTLASWLPTDDVLIKNNLYMTMEFRCQRKDAVSSSTSSLSKPFVWVGKLEHTIPLVRSDPPPQQQANEAVVHHHQQQQQLSHHTTKIVFCQSGQYVVTGLVRIKQRIAMKNNSSSDMNVVQQQQRQQQQLLPVATPEIDQEEIWWSPTSQFIQII